ncbi:MAG: phosphoglycolate phosphatase-like HAD superfamily hydrolase [Rhodothermales bacterium]|jgi:phosphoglycolate phosphatase-like HAD superfamily hydrolase
MIIALDFDGVLCDSAGEMAEAAWRAAAKLWPAEFTGLPPADFVEAFRALRPGLETGYESILFARLLRDGVALTAESAHQQSQALLAELLWSREDLVSTFGTTRDAWINSDLDGWLAAHEFYPGALDFLRRSQEVAKVLVITTKQTRFAQALLKGILAPDAVYGLESGNKVDTLCELRKTAPEIHFVEDRLDTLLGVVNCPQLNEVRLYLVDWGYNTVAQRREAGKHPRIHVLTHDFRAFALSGSANSL